MLYDYARPFGATAGGDLTASLPFLTWYGIGADKNISSTTWTRGEFWGLARRAAQVLITHAIAPGDVHMHYMSDNVPEDLAFRLGAVMLGTVPATINWQADTTQRIIGKLEAADAKLLLIDPTIRAKEADQLAAIRAALPELQVYCVGGVHSETDLLPIERYNLGLSPSATRIVIFSSGTTGAPKGVQLPYTSYACNAATFDSFLLPGSSTQVTHLPN